MLALYGSRLRSSELLDGMTSRSPKLTLFLCDEISPHSNEEQRGSLPPEEFDALLKGRRNGHFMSTLNRSLRRALAHRPVRGRRFRATRAPALDVEHADSASRISLAATPPALREEPPRFSHREVSIARPQRGGAATTHASPNLRVENGSIPMPIHAV